MKNEEKLKEILEDADYLIVVKEDTWTVVDAQTLEEWKPAELKDFQKNNPTIPGDTRKVFVEYNINPRLVCIGNRCFYR